MNLPIIQSLWIGEPLSNLEKLCIQSFLDNGHDFHLYIYDDVGDVPDGAIVKDATEIISAGEIYGHKHGKNNSFAPFSDRFRFELLYKKGGYWVDMDTVCIKPFDFQTQIVLSQNIEHEHNKFMRCSMHVIKFPAGHPALKELTERCANFNKTRRYMSFYYAFSDVVMSHDLFHFSQPPLCFNSTVKPFLGCFPTGIDLPRQTHAVHISDNALKKHNIYGKNDIFHEHSLYELLKKQHGIKNIPNANLVNTASSLAAIENRRKVKWQYKRKQHRIMAIACLVVGLIIGLVI